MASWVKGRLSPVQSGWVFALLFFGLFAFIVLPGPKPKPEPLPPFIVKPPSRLVALGLPDNPDLEHLPEFFALYADEAEWKDDKTIFAYWHPGANSYAYFFEATRSNGKYRFAPLDQSEVPNEDEVLDNGLYFKPEGSADCPIRFFGYATFGKKTRQPVLKPSSMTDIGMRQHGQKVPTVMVELPPPRSDPHQPDTESKK